MPSDLGWGAGGCFLLRRRHRWEKRVHERLSLDIPLETVPRRSRRREIMEGSDVHETTRLLGLHSWRMSSNMAMVRESARPISAQLSCHLRRRRFTSFCRSRRREIMEGSDVHETTRLLGRHSRPQGWRCGASQWSESMPAVPSACPRTWPWCGSRLVRSQRSSLATGNSS
jgi:hypothetical protein